MWRWYERLMRKRPVFAVILLFGSAATISILAAVVLGPRGALVPELLYLVFGLALTGFLALHFGRAALSIGLERGVGKAALVLAILPSAFAAFIAVQVVIAAADLGLPFDEVRAHVVRWHYQYAGRGPGSLHLTADDGSDLAMPAFELYSGPRTPGLYELEVTRVGHLVVDAHLLVADR